MVTKQIVELDPISEFSLVDLLAVSDNSAGNASRKGTIEQLRTTILSTTNVVPVFSSTDLPTPSAGKIQLADFKTYILFDTISVADTIVHGNSSRITDISIGNNTLNSSAAIIFSFEGASGTSIWERLTVAGDGTNTLFGGATALAGAGFGTSFCQVGNVLSCGTLTGIGFASTRSTIAGFSTGLTLNGGGLVSVNAVALVSNLAASNVICLTVSGVWTTGLVDWGNGSFVTSATGYAVKVDNALTASCTFTSNNYLGGSLFFDPAGLNYSATNVTALANAGYQSSAHVAGSKISGNATETVISTADTYTVVGVASTPSIINEGYSHSGNILTSTARSPSTQTIHVSGNVLSVSGGADVLTAGVFVNAVLVEEMEMTPDPTSSKPGNFSIATSILVSLGTTIEIRYKRLLGTINLIVRDELISIN